jgi:hypothetical protein
MAKREAAFRAFERDSEAFERETDAWMEEHGLDPNRLLRRLIDEAEESTP